MKNSNYPASLEANKLSLVELKEVLGGNVPPQDSLTQSFCTGWTGPDANGNTTFDMRSEAGENSCGIADNGTHPQIGDEV